MGVYIEVQFLDRCPVSCVLCAVCCLVEGRKFECVCGSAGFVHRVRLCGVVYAVGIMPGSLRGSST